MQAQMKEDIKAPRHWPLCGELTGDRWILCTKGQSRGKCFHLMASSWNSFFCAIVHLVGPSIWLSDALFYNVFLPCTPEDRSWRWRHNGYDSVSNHQPRHCLLNRLFGCISKKTSKLRVTGLCAGNSLETSEFPAQRASNAENASIWWRHHVRRNSIRLYYTSNNKTYVLHVPIYFSFDMKASVA